MAELNTGAEVTWCPGCGNFGIINAARKAVEQLEERGITRENIVMTAGIGCHAKIFDYLGLSGFYSLHGRGTATAQGIKVANPELKVISFSGDGDGFGEGLAHMMFAAKRNMDVTVVVHNNSAYALTTGQMSPTSERGWKGPSTPTGSVEDPFRPLALMLEAGATFVARGFSGNPKQLVELIIEGVEHEGFSIIEVLQPSVVFSNRFKEYRERTLDIEKNMDLAKAFDLVRKEGEEIPVGIIYRKEKQAFHKGLYGNKSPLRSRKDQEQRIRFLEQYLNQKK